MNQPLRYTVDPDIPEGVFVDKEGYLVKYSDYTAVVAENKILRKAIKDIEEAWFNQRSGDVIKIVDKAMEWKETGNE